MHIEQVANSSFVQTSADWLSARIRRATSGGRSAVIGLSGGSTPKPIYAELGGREGIDWSLVTFFLIDERYVPADHPDSNRCMIEEALSVAIGRGAKLVAPSTALPMATCVETYERALSTMFTEQSSRDRLCGMKSSETEIHCQCVVLGLGPDGHIASLFPPLTTAAYGPSLVIRTTTDRFAARERIGVTLPVLRSADERLFLISGAEKAALLRTMQSVPTDITRYPAQALFDERTTWIWNE